METFWRIYRAHARFDPTRGFEAWARTIATHAALDWLRTQQPETEFAAGFCGAGHGRPSHFSRDPQQNGDGFQRSCRRSYALRPFSRLLRNSRTRKSRTRSASPSRQSKCASFARFGYSEKIWNSRGSHHECKR